MALLIGYFAALVIIFVIPVMVYGLFSAVFGLKEPEKKLRFLTGVLLQKIGTTVGFVGLFYLGKEHFVANWLAYSLVWFVMFALTEIGQVFVSEYSKTEAVAGVISEAVYFLLAGFMLATLLG